MKKIKKMLVLIICIYMAICQINTKTFSYTGDEIKDIIDLKTVDEDGEPEKYDVEIKKEDLKDDIKFPVIQASIDYILYGDGEYSDINFFGLKSNKNEKTLKYVNNAERVKKQASWDKISNMVKDFLRVTIYISAASLLTLFIYFAVVITKGAIISSGKGLKIPGESLYKKEKNYTKELRDKKFVEQWIISVILVAFIVVIINLIISFSHLISNGILKLKGDEDDGLITIYLKADKNSSNTADIPDLPDDLENLQAKDLFPWGNIAYQNTDQPAGQEAMNYIFNTIGSLVNIAHSKFPMKKSLVIAQVVLESGWVSEYDDSTGIKRTYNNIIGLNAWEPLISPETTWYKKGAKTVGLLMPHGGGSTVDPAKAFDNLYECIEDYMGQFIYHHPAETFGDYNDITNYERYIHGYTPTEDAGRDMYVYYRDRIQKYNLERFDNMPDTPVGTKNNITSCYFKTDLEGLYMFEAQYNWDKHFLHNLIYIFCGILLGLFKWFLYGIFFLRLLVVGVLIVIAPIVIIIDSFKKINGNEGILKKWVIIFSYVVLLKPLLGAIYYIMTKINTSLVADNPLYILVVIIAMFIISIVSFIKTKQYISDKNRK